MKKQKRFIDFNQRLDNAVADCKKKCKCGHTKVVPYSTKYEYLICNWCGRRLYFDDAKQKEYDDKAIPKFLWNAKMRFGKTFASYQLAKRMNLKKILESTRIHE